MPQATGKELEGYMEAAAQTHRNPQSPVRWGTAFPSPVPDGTQGITTQDITVPLAPGHHHPISTQDTTTPSRTQDTTVPLAPGHHHPVGTEDITLQVFTVTLP